MIRCLTPLNPLLAKFEAWPTHRAFIERLKAHRLQAGLSLEQIAHYFDGDLEIVVGFEEGTVPVNFNVIRKWCTSSTPSAPPSTIS